jgi:hypothetical protein
MNVRRTLAFGAISAFALTGLAVAPASADSHLSCGTIEQSVADARVARAEAKEAFTTYRGTPHGKLVKEERAEARAEARQSRRELKDLAKAERSRDPERKATVRAQRIERRDLAKANRVLHSRQAVAVEIRNERRVLKQAWADAEVELREARRFQRGCEGAETEEPTEPAEPPADA